MEVLGIDVGFGFTKATNGREFVIFKSLIGEAIDIQFRTNIGNSSFVSNLHVTVDDKSYFVGDFAELQSSVRQFTLDQEKLISEYLKILALTVAGCICDKYTPINLVSGLPVGYLKSYYKKFTRILVGHHTITYHKPDGTHVTKKIHINKVRMMPQPLGSFFNLLMNDAGKIVNMDLTKQKVGVVDVGFRTTDFTILDQMRYVDRGSVTMDTGISKCFTLIANRLREESGITVELYRLYKAVENGTIRIKGQDYNISGLRDDIYSHAAKSIAGDMDRLWAEDWDIDTVILTGGGSRELAPHLQPLISGRLISVENNIDSRLNNVQGFLKFGRYEWRESASDSPAQEEEAE